MINNYLSAIKNVKLLNESTIDFPQPTLSDEVWDLSDPNNPTLKPENKNKILNLISEYPRFDIKPLIKTIHIIGSICSNQYLSNSDIDTHLIVHEEKLAAIIESSDRFKNTDDVIKDIMYYSKHADKSKSMIGQHPIELYIQLNLQQDLESDGCYDVIKDKWLAGPRMEKYDFNPYDYYKHLSEEIKTIAKKFDIALGELKRDVIDYSTIRDAVFQTPKESYSKLKKALEDKVVEIEADLKNLMGIKKDVIDMRRYSNRLSHDDKKWEDMNAKFKFLDRYHYLKIIRELEDIMKDNKVTDEEVVKIKNVLMSEKL